MAKSKKNKPGATKKVINKPAPAVKSKEVTKLQEIQSKYGKPIKNPDRELSSIKKDLSKLRRPIYKLNAQLREETSRYKKGKIKKQINEYKSSIDSKLNELLEKRTDVKELKSNIDQIRSEKYKLSREIRSINKKLRKADEDTDYQKIKELSYQLINKQQKIENLKEALGAKIKKIDVSGYEPESEKDERGYIEDPANPYTVWQAIRQFEADLSNPNWDYIIINSKRISTENMSLLTIEASDFWRSLQTVGYGTPRVLRFFNVKKKTVKYESYK